MDTLSRDRAVDRLFADLGESVNEVHRAAYAKLTDHEFLVVANTLRRMALRTKRAEEAACSLDPSRVYALRRALALCKP